MKKIWIGVAAILVLLGVFLPQILSTSVGKTSLEKALSQKLEMNVQIQTLHLAWFGPQRFEKLSFSSSDMQGSIEEVVSHLPLWSLSKLGDNFTLKEGTAVFPQMDPPLQITQVKATIQNHQVQATGATTQGGGFSIQGTIDLPKNIDIVADIKQMPPILFDQWLHAKGMLKEAIGPFLNLSGKVVLQHGEGTVVCELRSPNANAFLNGRIKERSLRLNEPFRANLQISPEFAKLLKKRFKIPLVRMKNPVTLQIAAQNTSIPLSPFSPKALEIGQGRLDLGQAVLDRVKGIASLLTMLHQASSYEVPIWFSPLDFSIREGIIYTERMDALMAGAIHLCCWGNIDLPANRLDMILGIPSDTLNSSLGIQGLSRNYVLQIPVRGSPQNPKFDSGPASAKIGMWLAGDQFTKKTGVFGGLFNSVTKLGEGGDNAPPPKRPFPWEK